MNVFYIIIGIIGANSYLSYKRIYSYNIIDKILRVSYQISTDKESGNCGNEF